MLRVNAEEEVVSVRTRGEIRGVARHREVRVAEMVRLCNRASPRRQGSKSGSTPRLLGTHITLNIYVTEDYGEINSCHATVLSVCVGMLSMATLRSVIIHYGASNSVYAPGTYVSLSQLRLAERGVW